MNIVALLRRWENQRTRAIILFVVWSGMAFLYYKMHASWWPWCVFGIMVLFNVFIEIRYFRAVKRFRLTHEEINAAIQKNFEELSKKYDPEALKRICKALENGNAPEEDKPL